LRARPSLPSFCSTRAPLAFLLLRGVVSHAQIPKNFPHIVLPAAAPSQCLRDSDLTAASGHMLPLPTVLWPKAATLPPLVLPSSTLRARPSLPSFCSTRAPLAFLLLRGPSSCTRSAHGRRGGAREPRVAQVACRAQPWSLPAPALPEPTPRPSLRRPSTASGSGHVHVGRGCVGGRGGLGGGAGGAGGEEGLDGGTSGGVNGDGLNGGGGMSGGGELGGGVDGECGVIPHVTVTSAIAASPL